MSDTLVPAPDGPRVLGMGVGTFVISVFCVLGIILCVAGRATPMPVLIYIISTAMVGLVILILVVAPREPSYVTEGDTDATTLTTTFFIGETLMAIMEIVAVLVAAVGLVLFSCIDPHNAIVVSDET